ncbi:hypothetical protein RhiJN_25803 [Ceratobasidium sp. AG-Ba]|nr:hypothetical protein RhiJN_25803 [Ceratobasidium sp. AG-Ba]
MQDSAGIPACLLQVQAQAPVEGLTPWIPAVAAIAEPVLPEPVAHKQDTNVPDPVAEELEKLLVAKEKKVKHPPKEMVVLLPAPCYLLSGANSKGEPQTVTPVKFTQSMHVQKAKTPTLVTKPTPRQDTTKTRSRVQGEAGAGDNLDDDGEINPIQGKHESSGDESQAQRLDPKSKSPEDLEWERAASDVELMVMPLCTQNLDADLSDDSQDPKVKPEPQDDHLDNEGDDLDDPVKPELMDEVMMILDEGNAKEGSTNSQNSGIDPSNLLPMIWVNNKNFQRFDQILDPLPPFIRCPYYLDNAFPHHLAGTLIAFCNKQIWEELDAIFKRALNNMKRFLIPTLKLVVNVCLNFMKQISQQIVLALHQTGWAEESYFLETLPSIMLDL